MIGCMSHSVTRLRIIAAAIFMTLFQCVAFGAETKISPVDTTVCQVMADPEQYDGKFVRLRARVRSEFEVSAIVDPDADCDFIWLDSYGGDPITMTSITSLEPNLNRPAVTLQRNRALKKLEKSLRAEMYPRNRGSICMDCKRYDVVATLTGRIDVAQGRSGFGHMNYYKVRMVLESVSSVSVKDLAASYDAGEYSTSPVRFPTAYLVGKVTDPSGRPVDGVYVDAYSAQDNLLFLPRFSESTDKKGLFKIEVPPGRYLVGINVTFPPAPGFPYPKTFFPGTTDQSSAKEISVSDRQKVDCSIHLPKRLVERRILVRVIWPDGRPVPDANVWLAEEDDPDTVVGHSVCHTRSDGTFELVGFEGTAYILRAGIYLKPSFTPYCAPKKHVGPDETITEPILMELSTTGAECEGNY